MPSKPGCLQIWAFGKAPRRFRALFPEGQKTDWLAHAPEQALSMVEPLLLRWQPLYPVKSIQLPDQSAVYWGAPREALSSIARLYPQVRGAPPPGELERRSGVRVRLERPLTYRTPKKSGSGHTVDISTSGMAFVTDRALAAGGRATVHVAWPVSLGAHTPLELSATGKLVRREGNKVAMQFDDIAFRASG